MLPRLRWPIVALVYVAITLAYSRTLLPVIGSALPNDTGDPGLNAWILWWNAHAVPLTRAWWDAPIFHPVHGALALSETFLNLWPLSTPMQWAGASAVVTYNVMFLLSFPAAALGAHALAHRLTARHDAGFIAGLAYGFAPYRAAQMPHLQMLWSCWMPVALFALHGFVETRRARYLWLFGVAWLMNGLSTGYYLFFFAVLAVLWVLWFARTAKQWLLIGLAAIVASLPLVPLLVGYHEYQSALGLERFTGDIDFFGADLSAVWTTTPYVLPHLWTVEPRPEGELYPGATIMALVVAGGVVAWRRLRPSAGSRFQPWLVAFSLLVAGFTAYAHFTGLRALRLPGFTISLNHPARAMFFAFCVGALAVLWNVRIVEAWRRRSSFLFYAFAAVVMLLFALGPHARFLGTTFIPEPPYYWLMQLPGGHAFRVPARFGMLFVLCLSIAASLGFAGLAIRRARAALAAGVCLAVGLEGFVAKMEVAEVPRPLAVAGLDRGAVMLELPIVDVFSDTAAMLRATQVGATLVNGFSGYLPPHYPMVGEGVANSDQNVLPALQEFGSFLVFVHQDRDPKRRYQDLVEEIADARRVMATPDGTLYQLPRRPASRLARGRPLGARAVDASANQPELPLLTDGDLRTVWSSMRPQKAGEEIRLSLDDWAVVTGAELDLGAFTVDYPRRLRLSVVTESGEQVAWEGSPAGLGVAGALREPKTAPIVIEFGRPFRGRGLVLTLLEDHDVRPWSLAELRVYGNLP